MRALCLCVVVATLCASSHAMTSERLRKLQDLTYDTETGLTIWRDQVCDEKIVKTVTANDVEACKETMLGELMSKSFTYDIETKSCKLYGVCQETKIASDTEIGNIYLYRQYEKPHRGFSSWNAFYRATTQDNLMAQLNNMETYGFLKAGYNVFHIDGKCTFDNIDSKDNYVLRTNMKGNDYTADSFLTEPKCLSMGVHNWTQLLHSKGFLVSWYTTGNGRTCSKHRIRQSKVYDQLVKNDLQTWKEWGIDILKIDDCGPQISPFRGDDKTMKNWAKWRDVYFPSLQFENCRYQCQGKSSGADDKFEDFCPYTATYFRSGGDIRPWADSIFTGGLRVASLNKQTGPSFGWAYGDALQVCNYDYATIDYRPNNKAVPKVTMTKNLEYAHIGMWFILSSPVFISTHIEKCSQDIIDLLLNEDLIAINERWSGDSGLKFYQKKDKHGHLIYKFRKVIQMETERWENILVVDKDQENNNKVEDFVPEDEIKSSCSAGYTSTKIYWNRGGGLAHRSTMFTCVTQTSSVSASPTYKPTALVPTSTPQPSSTPKPTTKSPTTPGASPTRQPTRQPTTKSPTRQPTLRPTLQPTTQVTIEGRDDTDISQSNGSETTGMAPGAIAGIAIGLLVAIVALSCCARTLHRHSHNLKKNKPSSAHNSKKHKHSHNRNRK